MRQKLRVDTATFNGRANNIKIRCEGLFMERKRRYLYNNFSSTRKTILRIYAITLALCIPYLIWSLTTKIYISCLFHTLTGYMCPGCGISRMFLSLARFDIARAFSYNPVVFMLLILWNVIAILCFSGKIRFVQSKRFLYSAFWISVAVLVIYGIVRNIS